MFTIQVVNAQQVFLKNYSVNQGLPSSECYSVLQDSKRFLWISTDAGLVKYNGYSFKVDDMEVLCMLLLMKD